MKLLLTSYGYIEDQGETLTTVGKGGQESFLAAPVGFGERSDQVLVRAFWEDFKLKVFPEKFVGLVERFGDDEQKYHELLFLYKMTPLETLTEAVHRKMDDLPLSKGRKSKWLPSDLVKTLQPDSLNILFLHREGEFQHLFEQAE